MSRLVLSIVVACGGLASLGGVAFAQLDGSIEMEVQLPEEDGTFQPRSVEETRRFFNRANCLCSGVEFGVEFRLMDVPTPPQEEVEIWFGTQCDSPDVTIRDANCQLVHTFEEVDDLRGAPKVGFSIEELAGGCEPNRRERRIFAIIDPDDDGVDAAQGDYANSIAVSVDTQAPPVPRDIEATGGEGAIQLSWTAPESRPEDVEYYQVLCARADGSIDEDDELPRSSLSPRYLTTEAACDVADPSICPQPVAVERVLPGDVDAGPDAPDAGTVAECIDLPGELETLDEMHLCGEATGTETSVRVDGLENGVAYHVVLVVVDPARNPLALDLGAHQPSPAEDFWEHYRDRGGRARGGCSMADGRGGLLVLALLALSLGRSIRRRRRPGGRLGLGLLIGMLGASSASAQPWWEDVDEPVQDEVGAAPIRWGFELKLGPYVPAVDSEFDLAEGEAGPFEAMFGDGPFLMSGITVDHYFFRQFGQLGVTGSAGFLSKTARAFQQDDEGNLVLGPDGEPMRSEGDKTRFRMIPTSLGVVYRLTELDDRFRVPLVPYGRIGLSYYYWWVTGPGGSIAEVPTMDCPDLSADCDGDKARGGSLGWQASAGLAVRLERLDPDAEVALRTELGIEHAGLAVEITYAVVNGFGSGERLRLGDATWFGGIFFEF
jgi:hypothetical protein